jgi:hypothetical protein
MLEVYRPSQLLVVAGKEIAADVGVNRALQGFEQMPLPRLLFDDTKVGLPSKRAASACAQSC